MESAYDQLNPWGPDYDYWLAVARRLSPHTIVDLGCGTGQLTVLLANIADEVIGVDPDPEMLSVARSREGTNTVTWIDGYAEDVAHAAANLVTMTSHVSQVFLTDEHWSSTLITIARVLRPGGSLLFDMRNPLARGWEEWNPVDSREVISTEEGPAEQWHEVTSVDGGLVSFTSRIRWTNSGRTEEFFNVLRFRDEAELRRSLGQAGFTVARCDGDWDGSVAVPTSRELIITATLPEVVAVPGHRSPR